MAPHRYDPLPDVEHDGDVPITSAADGISQTTNESVDDAGTRLPGTPVAQEAKPPTRSSTASTPQQTNSETGGDLSTAQLLSSDGTSDAKPHTSSEHNVTTPLPFASNNTTDANQAHPDRERTASTFSGLREKTILPFSPAAHDQTDPLAESTAREYNHARQTHRLWRLSVGECLLTFLICGAYAGVLVAYSKMDIIDRKDRHWFNAVITGISLLLGVNLTASLRSYAKLLRWLLLAQRYQPLEIFDLVLGCDSLWNVIKLILKGKNLRGGKKRFLPSWTQILAFAWFLVNLSITVFVGMIGLNFSLDINQMLLTTHEGSINVTDWNSLANLPFYNAIQEIQSYGIRGFPIASVSSLSYWDAGTGIYETADNGTTKYWFGNWNPTDIRQASLSPYYFLSTATCQSFNVTQGQFGNLTWFTYENENGKSINMTYPESKIPGPGGLLASSKIHPTCNEAGCVNINIFMSQSNSTAADDPYSYSIFPMPVAMFYNCVNTLSSIIYSPTYTGQEYVNSDDYQISDNLRYMLAGSIGWDGEAPEGDGDWTFQPYDLTTDVASAPVYDYNGVPNATNMADFVSSFAMKGISSMDDLNVGLPFTQIQGLTPITAQILDVTWKYVIPLLSGIPAVHLLTLLIVFFLANQAIIKDDSHIAMAKLYYNILRDHGFDQRGCMLKGDEIIKDIGNPLVAYGWNNSGKIDHQTNRKVFHVDVFEKDADGKRHFQMVQGWRKKFPRNVLYDGELRQRNQPKEISEVGEIRVREFDAKDYF